MNLSIINGCTHRCSFCFQKDWYLKKNYTEMSLEDVERFLKWLGDSSPNLKLLGGEPLLHSKFSEILGLVRKYEKTVKILTNCSLNCDPIIENKDVIQALLINIHYTNKDRPTFLSNIDSFIKNNVDFTLSYTFDPLITDQNRDISKFEEVFSRIPESKVISIRLGLMSPTAKEFQLHDYSIDLVRIMTELYKLKSNLEFCLDCSVNACELDPKVIEVLKKKGVGFRLGVCDTHPPFDVLLDFSAIWCSSSKFIKIKNIFDYKDYMSAENAIKQKWEEYWLNTKVMCNHANCGKFNPAICLGLCAARNEALRSLDEEIFKKLC